MKRKRTPKLTTAELLAAGHVELAEHLRKRLAVSMTTRHPKFKPRKNQGFIPTPETP